MIGAKAVLILVFLFYGKVRDGHYGLDAMVERCSDDVLFYHRYM